MIESFTYLSIVQFTVVSVGDIITKRLRENRCTKKSRTASDLPHATESNIRRLSSQSIDQCLAVSKFFVVFLEAPLYLQLNWTHWEELRLDFVAQHLRHRHSRNVLSRVIHGLINFAPSGWNRIPSSHVMCRINVWISRYLRNRLPCNNLGHFVAGRNPDEIGFSTRLPIDAMSIESAEQWRHHLRFLRFSIDKIRLKSMILRHSPQSVISFWCFQRLQEGFQRAHALWQRRFFSIWIPNSIAQSQSVEPPDSTHHTLKNKPLFLRKIFFEFSALFR